MATIARPSIVHVAEEKAPIPAPGASHDCAPFVERHRQGGLLALALGVGLSVVAEIFEEELTQLVGPRGKHRPDRRGGAPADLPLHAVRRFVLPRAQPAA